MITARGRAAHPGGPCPQVCRNPGRVAYVSRRGAGTSEPAWRHGPVLRPVACLKPPRVGVPTHATRRVVHPRPVMKPFRGLSQGGWSRDPGCATRPWAALWNAVGVRATRGCAMERRWRWREPGFAVERRWAWRDAGLSCGMPLGFGRAGSRFAPVPPSSGGRPARSRRLRRRIPGAGGWGG